MFLAVYTAVLTACIAYCALAYSPDRFTHATGVLSLVTLAYLSVCHA